MTKIQVHVNNDIVAEFESSDGLDFSEMSKKYRTDDSGQLMPTLAFAPVTLEHGVVWDAHFFEWCKSTPLLYSCGCESWKDRAVVRLSLIEQDGESSYEAFLYGAIPTLSNISGLRADANSFTICSVTFEFEGLEVVRG